MAQYDSSLINPHGTMTKEEYDRKMKDRTRNWSDNAIGDNRGSRRSSTHGIRVKSKE